MTASAPAYLRAGDVVLRRFRRPDGRAEPVHPCRVVRDDADGLVFWLAPGTPLLRPVVADGRDIRSVPLAERFDYARHGRAARLDTWRDQGILGIIPVGTPWSVWLFWTDEWKFRGWYVNLEDPSERVGCEVVTQDHILDLVVRADRRMEWKDEDELEAAVLACRFSVAEARRIRANGQAAAAVVAAWGSPFCDGWEGWRPDPAWPVPSLPPELAASAEYR